MRIPIPDTDSVRLHVLAVVREALNTVDLHAPLAEVEEGVARHLLSCAENVHRLKSDECTGGPYCVAAAHIDGCSEHRTAVHYVFSSTTPDKPVDGAAVLKRLTDAGVIPKAEQLRAEDEAGIERETITPEEFQALLDASATEGTDKT